MAEHTVTTYTDDLDGSDGARSVSFAFDGRSYAIDLTDRNRARMAKALEPYIAAARRSGRHKSGGRQAGGGTRKSAAKRGSGRTLWSGLDEDEKDRMRAWGTRRRLTTKTARRIADSAVQAWVDAGKP